MMHRSLLELRRAAVGRVPSSSQILARSYHENIVEHYENPRNVGSFDKNDDMVGTVRFKEACSSIV